MGPACSSLVLPSILKSRCRQPRSKSCRHRRGLRARTARGTVRTNSRDRSRTFQVRSLIVSMMMSSTGELEILGLLAEADCFQHLGRQLAGIQNDLFGIGIFYGVHRHDEVARIFDIDHQLVATHLTHRTDIAVSVVKKYIETFLDFLVHGASQVWRGTGPIRGMILSLRSAIISST